MNSKYKSVPHIYKSYEIQQAVDKTNKKKSSLLSFFLQEAKNKELPAQSHKS